MKHDQDGVMNFVIVKGLRFFISKRKSNKNLEERIIQSIKNLREKMNRCIMGFYVMQ